MADKKIYRCHKCGAKDMNTSQLQRHYGKHGLRTRRINPINRQYRKGIEVTEKPYGNLATR